MADIEIRVDKLEEKVVNMEKMMTSSLGDIKKDLVEIKGYVQGGDRLVDEKIRHLEEKVKNLEGNQSKFVWTIVLEFLALAFAGIKYYIMVSGGK